MAYQQLKHKTKQELDSLFETKLESKYKVPKQTLKKTIKTSETYEDYITTRKEMQKSVRRLSFKVGVLRKKSPGEITDGLNAIMKAVNLFYDKQLCEESHKLLLTLLEDLKVNNIETKTELFNRLYEIKLSLRREKVPILAKDVFEADSKPVSSVTITPKDPITTVEASIHFERGSINTILLGKMKQNLCLTSQYNYDIIHNSKFIVIDNQINMPKDFQTKAQSDWRFKASNICRVISERAYEKYMPVFRFHKRYKQYYIVLCIPEKYSKLMTEYNQSVKRYKIYVEIADRRNYATKKKVVKPSFKRRGQR